MNKKKIAALQDDITSSLLNQNIIPKVLNIYQQQQQQLNQQINQGDYGKIQFSNNFQSDESIASNQQQLQHQIQTQQQQQQTEPANLLHFQHYQQQAQHLQQIQLQQSQHVYVPLSSFNQQQQASNIVHYNNSNCNSNHNHHPYQSASSLNNINTINNNNNNNLHQIDNLPKPHQLSQNSLIQLQQQPINELNISHHSSSIQHSQQHLQQLSDPIHRVDDVLQIPLASLPIVQIPTLPVLVNNHVPQILQSLDTSDLEIKNIEMEINLIDGIICLIIY
jgi:hypothetical protein